MFTTPIAELHERATVERWAERFGSALRSLAEVCREMATAGRVAFTPSDFPLARLDQENLDRVLAAGLGSGGPLRRSRGTLSG